MMKRPKRPTPKQLELSRDVIEARAHAIAKAVLKSKPKPRKEPKYA